MLRLFGLSTLAIVLCLSVACGGDSKGGILNPATPEPATPPNVTVTAPATTAPQPTTPPQATGPTDLSLVYIDSRPGTATLYVAGYDGKAPKQVGQVPAGTRALDVRGSTLVAANGPRLLLIDLKTGVSKTLDTQGDVRDGRYLNDGAFVYTTAGGCGGSATGGPPMSRIWILDFKSFAPKQVSSGSGNTISVIGVDPASGRVAIIKRGCDPGIAEFYIVDTNTAAEIQKVPVFGCGAASVAVDKKLALVASCGTAPNKPDVQATMVNFAGSSPVLTDVKTAAGTTINFAPFQIKSGGTQVALGTQEVLTTPKAGGARSAGLFLYDLSTASLTPAAPAEGAEQYAIGWSPDGRYLLAASVQAQGVCGFSIIDTTSKAVTKVDPGITVCGLSGGMIGWTKLGI